MRLHWFFANNCHKSGKRVGRVRPYKVAYANVCTRIDRVRGSVELVTLYVLNYFSQTWSLNDV